MTDTSDAEQAKARGERIKARRLALGMRGVDTFAREMRKEIELGRGLMSPPDRKQITAAEKGEARSLEMYERIEAWLNYFDERMGSDMESEPDENDLIEFNVSGDFGVNVIVKGPIRDADVLRRQVAALVREIRGKDPQQD